MAGLGETPSSLKKWNTTHVRVGVYSHNRYCLPYRKYRDAVSNPNHNMDATGLYWRRMPNGGLLTASHAGRKMYKGRISIATATNAIGSDQLRLKVD